MKFRTSNLFFLTNYICTLLYMSRLVGLGKATDIIYALPLALASLILMDITYLGSCNIRKNRIVTMFLSLLALDCWYMLLAADTGKTGNFLFYMLSPVIWYVSLLFVLTFLFQGNGYRFQKTVEIILTLACLAPFIGFCISKRAFAFLYGIQFLSNIFCFLFLIIYHRRQMVFVLKSQWNYFFASTVIVTVLFFAYYFATKGMKNHISNFGIYLPVLLFFISIHSIVQKEHKSLPLSTVFDRKQAALILCFSLALTTAVTFLTESGYGGFLIGINSLAAIFYICNIVWEYGLKNGEGKVEKDSRYQAVLQQFLKEEALKNDFAAFLHDDILQDLLSIKNLMGKAEKPEIQSLIRQTLENLSIHIRKEMQDYHPVFLKKLTAKENLENLMESVAQSFPKKKIKCHFYCKDSLFLPEPYNMLIYRYLKELLTNVYKHSNGNTVFITLSRQKNILTLSIRDNGTGKKSYESTSEGMKYKGIASIKEQVTKMEGSLKITSTPKDYSTEILIPMKGDVSYQYFIS